MKWLRPISNFEKVDAFVMEGRIDLIFIGTNCKYLEIGEGMEHVGRKRAVKLISCN